MKTSDCLVRLVPDTHTYIHREKSKWNGIDTEDRRICDTPMATNKFFMSQCRVARPNSFRRNVIVAGHLAANSHYWQQMPSVRLTDLSSRMEYKAEKSLTFSLNFFLFVFLWDFLQCRADRADSSSIGRWYGILSPFNFHISTLHLHPIVQCTRTQAIHYVCSGTK